MESNDALLRIVVEIAVKEINVSLVIILVYFIIPLKI